MYRNLLNILKFNKIVNFVYIFILIKYNQVKIIKTKFAIFVVGKYTPFNTILYLN